MKLFVYGTLCLGEKNHHVLNGATLVCARATIQAVMYDTGNGYPAIELNDASIVIGEVYEVPEHLWSSLDELEEYTGNSKKDLYNKVTATVKVGFEEIETVVYTVCDVRMKGKVIPSGDWGTYRKLMNK